MGIHMLGWEYIIMGPNAQTIVHPNFCTSNRFTYMVLLVFFYQYFCVPQLAVCHFSAVLHYTSGTFRLFYGDFFLSTMWFISEPELAGHSNRYFSKQDAIP